MNDVSIRIARLAALTIALALAWAATPATAAPAVDWTATVPELEPVLDRHRIHAAATLADGRTLVAGDNGLVVAADSRRLEVWPTGTGSTGVAALPDGGWLHWNDQALHRHAADGRWLWQLPCHNQRCRAVPGWDGQVIVLRTPPTGWPRAMCEIEAYGDSAVALWRAPEQVFCAAHLLPDQAARQLRLVHASLLGGVGEPQYRVHVTSLDDGGELAWSWQSAPGPDLVLKDAVTLPQGDVLLAVTVQEDPSRPVARLLQLDGEGGLRRSLPLTGIDLYAQSARHEIDLRLAEAGHGYLSWQRRFYPVDGDGVVGTPVSLSPTPGLAGQTRVTAAGDLVHASATAQGVDLLRLAVTGEHHLQSLPMTPNDPPRLLLHEDGDGRLLLFSGLNVLWAANLALDEVHVIAADGEPLARLIPPPRWHLPAAAEVAVLAGDAGSGAIIAHRLDDTVLVQAFDAEGEAAWQQPLPLAGASRVDLRACGSGRICLLSDAGSAWLDNGDGTVVATLPAARDALVRADGGLTVLQHQQPCQASGSCRHEGARIDIDPDGNIQARHEFDGAPLAVSPGGAVLVRDDGGMVLLDVEGEFVPYPADAIPSQQWLKPETGRIDWGYSALVDDDGLMIGLHGRCALIGGGFPCMPVSVVASGRDGVVWHLDTAVPGQARISAWQFLRDPDPGAGAGDILLSIHHAPGYTPGPAPTRDDAVNLLKLSADGELIWQRNLISAGMGQARVFQVPGQQAVALVRPGSGQDSLVVTVLDAANGELRGEHVLACPAGNCQGWWFDLTGHSDAGDDAVPALVALAMASDSATLMQASAGLFQAAPGIALVQAGLSGAWYAPRSAGQGFALQLLPGADGTTVFMPWFTFHWASTFPGVEGLQWYVLDGLIDPQDTVAELDIWLVTGGRFLEPGGDQVRVGRARLSFPSCSQALLDYHLDELFAGQSGPSLVPPMGPDGVIALHPLLPAGGPCVDNGSDDGGGDEAPDMLRDPYLSGVWYDPATSGQGMVIQHLLGIGGDGEIEQGPQSQDLLFGTWFSHDAAEPTGWLTDQHWFTFQSMPDAGPEDGDGIHAVIHQTIGGRLDGPATGDHYRVGEVELLPQSCRELVLRWRFDDRPEAGQFRNLEGEIQLFRLGDCEYPLD